MFESQNVKEGLIESVSSETVNQSADGCKREAVEDQRAHKHHLKGSF